LGSPESCLSDVATLSGRFARGRYLQAAPQLVPCIYIHIVYTSTTIRHIYKTPRTMHTSLHQYNSSPQYKHTTIAHQCITPPNMQTLKHYKNAIAQKHDMYSQNRETVLNQHKVKYSPKIGIQ